MTDNIPAIPLSPSGRQLNIPLANPAEEERDVFIPLNKTVAALKALIAQARDDGENVVFIRAPVASGKTTLANYLRKKHSDKFVYVDFATSQDQWYQHVIDASGEENLSFLQVRNALKKIAQQEKVIVIDEAHLIFGYPGVVSTFFKRVAADSAPMFLLFSASGSSEDNEGNSFVTPQEIRRKYMWYPPIPNLEKLRIDLVEAKKPVVLDTDSINFIVTLCGGHRGIIMNAIKWIQEQQQNAPVADESLFDSKKTTSWTITDTVAQVRRSLEHSALQEGGQRWNKGLRKFLQDCRAVRVNGKYYNLQNIPKEFGLVLYEGPKKMEELNNQERKLTISGFLFPERRRGAREEFIQYDWNDSEVMYSVPNPVMAEYYGDVLPKQVQYKRRLLKETKKPNSAADLMARVLPFLTFSEVVVNPISRQDGSLSNCLSKKGMPHEDDYNGAIAHILKHDLRYQVSTPLDCSLGKTDVVVSYEDGTTCAIESILAAQPPRAHVEHAERFLNENKTNYYEAAQKLLLIIGGSGTREVVKDRIQHVSTALEGQRGALEIVGIYVSLNHGSYEMYREGDPEPLYFVCDRVPKTLQRDSDGRFKTAQVCVFESDDEAPDAKKSKSSS
mmetsp:Transcript_14808/g.33613  ORF Transcript_14808/g.33613 Transcript_14808/m.33613 type:complete len:616 (+) Transcript_14808:106-1953(+)